MKSKDIWMGILRIIILIAFLMVFAFVMTKCQVDGL